MELQPHHQISIKKTEPVPVEKENKINRKPGLINFVLFLHELPTIKKAYSLMKQGKSLEAEHLRNLRHKYRAEILGAKILRLYQKAKVHNPNRKSNLAIAVIKSIQFEIFLCHFLELLFILLRIFTAFSLKMALDPIASEEPQSLVPAYYWLAILSVSQMLSIYVEHHMYDIKCTLPIYIKGALSFIIYEKITRLSVYNLNKISSGKLVNIVANDLNIFERSGLFFTHPITGILGLVAGTAVIWYFFNVSVLLGIGFMLSTLIIHRIVASVTIKYKDNVNHVTDQRVKITSEIIEGIRLLKMYTWELIFSKNITDVRRKELNFFKVIKRFESVSRGVAYSTHASTTFLMYLLFTLTGGVLTAPTVFATHNLFTFMRKFSAIFVGQGLIFLSEASSLLRRISEIIDTPEIEGKTFSEPDNLENTVEFEKFSASWSIEDETLVSQIGPDTAKSYTLKEINLSLKKGSLNALVGKVGAGKTSFLLSFTGEMPTTIGQLKYRGQTAYVEQEPTIFAGTLRENILFGKAYDPVFYHKVIENCHLESDFKLFPNGDLSDVGEKGNNLSGGQKARLALARAIYADAEIYLLDDPLSAVDAKVARCLYNDAIKGMLKSKTVILATHQVHFVKDADKIMVINDGKIAAHGTYHELETTYPSFHHVFADHHEDHHDEEDKKRPEIMTTIKRKESLVEKVGSLREIEDEADPEQEEVKLRLETVKPSEQKPSNQQNDDTSGNVTLRTYWKYFRQMGNNFFLLALLSSVVFTQLGNLAFGRMLAAWTTNELDQNTSLAATGGVVAFIFLIYLVHYFLYDKMVVTASKNFHEKMLKNVVKSPVSFFDKNPLGRILNRFSNDIGIIDVSLPASMIDAIDENAIILALVIAVMAIEPWTILPTFGAVVVIALLIKYCFPAIKQTRNYELVSRGPFSSQFSSTLSGIVILRSYKQTTTIRERFITFVNNNSKGSAGYISSSRFFAIYVDVFYTFAAIGNSYLVIALGDSPGLTAFALMLVVSVTGAIQFALRQLLQTHIFMSSPARVQDYCENKPEAALALRQDKDLVKNGWPQAGKIEFNRIFMKYRPDLDYVLKDLSLMAKPGEKIGCVGRTGAGKSTILQILFRMVEIDKQHEYKDSTFVKIDDQNTESMGLHLLRENISIIPQIPFCFTGTVRKNLDPMGTFSEEELWKVLEDVNLKSYVESLKDGLNTDMTDVSSVFSVGQKQLVCLARAILKKKKILVLDEATANIDMQTDNFIQKKISEKFNQSTIFTIAHRLTTVAHYDKILVLDKGRRMEYDHPYALLVNEIGDDSITKQDGYFAAMVRNTGEKTANQILKVAKESYFLNTEKINIDGIKA